MDDTKENFLREEIQEEQERFTQENEDMNNIYYS